MTTSPATLRLCAAVILLAGPAAGYFYFFNQFWTHRHTAAFTALAEFTSPCFQAYRGRQILIHREFLPVLKGLESHAEKRGVKLLVTSSYRPPQAAVKDIIVTPAKKSNHLAGHAVDLNVWFNGKLYESTELRKEALPMLPQPVQGFIDDIRRNPIMRWGGDFETADPVHVDDGFNLRHETEWERHYLACWADYRQAAPKWRHFLESLF